MAKELDPLKLSSPRIFLIRMLVFVILVGLVGFVLHKQIEVAFMANPGLNALILALRPSASSCLAATCCGFLRKSRGSTISVSLIQASQSIVRPCFWLRWLQFSAAVSAAWQCPHS